MTQFAVYRSILSAISVSIVVLSLMSFPHVPWYVLTGLQWYNLGVMFVKMTIQLPIFCADGAIRVSKSQLFGELRVCAPCERTPWTVIFGLVKVVSDQHLKCGVYISSTRSLLWADLWVFAVILMNMFVARYSGQFNTSSEILDVFAEQDRVAAATGSNDSRIFFPRARVPTAERVANANERIGTAAWSFVTPKFILQWLVSSVCEVVTGSSRTRRPSCDLYAIRFSFALGCLGMLLFGWRTMTGHGRSFSESISLNSFSGSQVIILCAFLINIVIDRSLYVWYTQDGFSRDFKGWEDRGYESEQEEDNSDSYFG